jgi:autotransporter translocation and assembly factor TamB
MNNDNPLQPVPPQGSSSSNTGTSNTGISGGKYIANGVYVGAAQGLSGETQSKVEIEVLPHVRAVSQAGTRSEQAGVNWQIDY